MKKLEEDFENLDGFVVDLSTEESTTDAFLEYCDPKIYLDYAHDLNFERYEVVKYLTSTYDCVLVKAPNVYQVVEEDLFVKEIYETKINK